MEGRGGRRTGAAVDDSSSEDGSEELMDSSDDDEKLDNRQSDRASDVAACSLDHLLRLHLPPRLHARTLLLLRAHQQLDVAEAQVCWSTIWDALRAFGPGSPQAERGFERGCEMKNLRRLNTGLTYQQDCCISSIRRLGLRVDSFISGLMFRGSLQYYCRLLRGVERKAFNACLQFWKKQLRGKVLQKIEDTRAHRITTSLEASLLCRTDKDSRLVICLAGTRIENWSLLRDELEDKVHLSSDKDVWRYLDICADTALQVRGALEVSLSLSISFRCILLHQHGGKRTISKTPMVLPASILQCRDLGRPSVCIDWKDDPDIFTTSDFQSIVRSVGAKRGLQGLFPQPAKMAKLASIASLVIRSHAIDISALPIHLQESTWTACRCSSCKRIMTSGRLAPLPLPSPSDLAYYEQATQAGFKVPRRRLDDIEALIASGSCYLPSVTDSVRIRNVDANPYKESILRIGGHSVWYPRPTAGDEDEDKVIASTTNWQFCTHCLGLHLGVWQDGNQRCGCFVCTGQDINPDETWWER